MGIVIDHRRNRRSEESEKVNVERLKEYRSRLIVFPKKAGKAKKGDSSVRIIFGTDDACRTHLADHTHYYNAIFVSIA